ncbi:type II toxin-antitoxin system ParD family antitoxin [Methylorubrum rhodesianum]|uniref:type II toxin-antitoxin system ParD family antitoxin n=1 Tax=Methylorubrum rhodesianum TaxID=29427 RepID=UPI003CFEF7D9
MTKNTSITLGDHFVGFIEQQVEIGRFGNASEVIRAGLRLLEEHEDKVKALKSAIQAGEESGDFQPFDPDTFIENMQARHGR